MQVKKSCEILDGWSYEKDHAGNPGVWTDKDSSVTPLTFAGVPVAYVPPTVAAGNRVRYVVQTALTAGQTYSFIMNQAEIVAHLI